MKQSHSYEQRELDAVRYNTDGRCFRLKIKGDILTLEVISPVAWHERLLKTIPEFLMVMLGISFFASISVVVWICLVIILTATYMTPLIRRNSPLNSGAKWDFNCSLNTLCINDKDFGSLSEIIKVDAWNQKKNRFLISLVFENGERLLIGEEYFSTKEFSWREDAQIIANFLNVPLQIPDVFAVEHNVTR